MFRSLHKLCLLAALAAGTLAGCTSHSIPIPPPDPEKVFFSLDLDAGAATFRYGGDPVYGGATVYVFNRQAGEGIITTAGSDGSVMATTPFPAMQGDEVVISVEAEGQLSSVCLEMRDGQSGNDQRCSNF
jgi:hypothetical protein